VNAQPVSFEEAQKEILESITPLTRTEKIPITQAAGQVLAHDVVALSPTPRFDRSVMDGYAVRAIDTEGASPGNPAVLRQVGEIFPNVYPRIEVAPGECVKLFTGSIMPAGTDAVVRIEDTSRMEEYVGIKCTVGPGNFVAQRGSDIREGETVLNEGVLLDPAKVGVLASQGNTEIEVYARPRVAIVSTGDEIGCLGSELKEGQIYDVNSNTLAALVIEQGGVPFVLPSISDEIAALKQALEKAVTADLVVVSGGSSVGDKDLLQDVLELMGEVVFHGIRIKPGQPTAFAKIQGKPVLNMPGPPTACLMNAYLLLLPAIKKLSHRVDEHQPLFRAKIANYSTASSHTTKSLPVCLTGDTAVSVLKKSGDILATSRANGYVIIGENTEIGCDSEVLVRMF
jgi:molybdenum cofactor synthesis domain-containing protein